MNVEELLKEKLEKQRIIAASINKIGDQIRQLNESKQTLLQEAFRNEGSISTLKEIKERGVGE